ncbi:hypothetical protein HPB47_010818 [Ixodes persulcatus]|uniref:Uncharacterized protein n=1 Tax=Ixodes persulcatus TaxID=34615 RepID=A0AC60NY15_IXOPE|nr:hypothetical protein HPB47_010818 [Ixodes persulcatus]
MSRVEVSLQLPLCLRVCYTDDTFQVSEDARAEMRRMSKENRDATEALELEISDLVRQLKLTPAGARKDELAAQLKERQQRLKTVREEFRRKLQELMGNASPGTGLPDIITHEPEPPNPAVTLNILHYVWLGHLKSVAQVQALNVQTLELSQSAAKIKQLQPKGLSKARSRDKVAQSS